jgi:phage terminase large subunit GpA-like protein
VKLGKTKGNRRNGRKEDYKPGTIPDGVLFLTAGVDVQKDRIELEIVGWSKNLVSYSIDYVSIIGDPTLSETWEKLDAIKDKIYLNEKNKKFQIEKMAIDTGFNTQIVYNYIRNSRDSRLMAIKGLSSGALMVGQPKYIDVKNDGKTYRRGLAFYPVAVSLIKEELYSFLNLEKSVDGNTPRGYCHFPEYEAEYFKMLTAEQKKTISKRGVNVSVWEKIRNRNEALDCRVYARAAAYQFGIDRFTDDDWKSFETRLKDQELKKDVTSKKTIKRRKSDFW